MPRTDGNDFRSSTPDSVNKLIQRPIDERAQQSCSGNITDSVATMQHQHGGDPPGVVFVLCFMDSFLHQASLSPVGDFFFLAID